MPSIVIENGDVIDGMGNEPQRGMDVVIDGNRIASVQVSLRDKAEEAEAAG